MPETGTFLSVDPVESEPPYAYVRGNPVNWVDPSGLIYCDPISGYCQEIDRFLCSHTQGAYDERMLPCIVDPNNVNTQGPAYISPWPILLPPSHSPSTVPPAIPVERDPARLQTFSQLINNTGVTGYLEGWAVSGTALTCNLLIVGQEIVYDFYTGQRAIFNFIGQPYEDAPIPIPAGESIPTLADISGSGHAGFIWGFDREPVGDLVREYSGPSVVGFGTGQVPLPMLAGIVTLNGTANLFSSASEDWYGWWPNRDVYGVSFGAGAGAGGGVWDLPVSVGAIRTNYSLDYEFSPYSYRDDMMHDIRNGVGVPTASNWLLTAINYATEYRTLAADVAMTASPDAEWIKWE